MSDLSSDCCLSKYFTDRQFLFLVIVSRRLTLFIILLFLSTASGRDSVWQNLFFLFYWIIREERISGEEGWEATNQVQPWQPTNWIRGLLSDLNSKSEPIIISRQVQICSVESFPLYDTKDKRFWCSNVAITINYFKINKLYFSKNYELPKVTEHI